MGILWDKKGTENPRIVRNRSRKGEAIGKAIGKSVGKAYEHIGEDVIFSINKIVEVEGFINVEKIREMTNLATKSLGGFVKSRLPHLKSRAKMIKGERETRYY